MLTKEDIRYSRPWVRALCVWSVAAVVSFLTCFRIITPLENALAALIAPEAVELYGRVSLFLEVESMFLFALVLAAPRIRYPFLMMLYVAAILFLYTAAIIAVFYVFNVIMPMASLLITVVAGAGVLGSLAWNEEQYDLRQMQALDRMHRELTDMLVHDLKKKLSSLMLSIGLLKKDSPTGSAGMLETLKTSAEQMLLLVTNLLDIRKFQVGRIELSNARLALKELLCRSVDEHRAIADLLGISLQCSFDGDVCAAADSQMISRVAMNLIWNAIQHAPAGSTVEIACGSNDGRPFIRVSNRGAVIPASLREHLFEPFLSGGRNSGATFSDSTGLGLAFCKLAMEAHKGTITVESPWQEHGDGVSVSVTFAQQSAPLQ